MTEQGIDKYPARPLTRGQVKELRRQGICLGDMSGYDEQRIDETIDAVLAMVLPPAAIAALDDEPNSVAMALFQRVVGLTYGKGDDQKNSSGSGSGTVAAAPSDAATAAGSPKDVRRARTKPRK